MFVLNCPSCRHQVRVRFARAGATATCVACKSLFKLEEATMQPVDDPSPPAPPPPLPATVVAAPVPGRAKSAVKRVASKVPLPRQVKSPMGVVTVAVVALTLAIVMSLYESPIPPPKPGFDIHPLPVPLASAVDVEYPPAPIGPEENSGEADDGAPRVELTEVAGAAEALPADAVALDSVPSRIGVGATTITLAVRNVSRRPVRDPRFVVDVTDEKGKVLKSWRGSLIASIAPGQVLEFEALPPTGMDPAGRLVLRAFATPQP